MARKARSRRIPAAQRRKAGKGPRHTKHRGHKHHRDSSPLTRQLTQLEDRIAGFLYSNNGRGELKEIAAGLGMDSRSKIRDLDHTLKALCRGKTLSCTGREYRYTRQKDLVEATLAVNPRGFGFATPLTSGKDQGRKNDIFIPGRELGSASHGDRVLIRLSPSGKEGPEGRVIRVLARSSGNIVGIYRTGRTTSYVIPEDARYTFRVMVKPKQSGGAEDGEAVAVELTSFPAGERNPEGKVSEVLGDPDSPAVQAKMVILAHDLPHVFLEEALNQAKNFDGRVLVDEYRQDLREIVHVTIDGETAKDFDDAVAIEKTGQGYRLYVSIADVSHYVTPGSPIDIEAYKRGTSVYFPGQVVPMLPERLSNDLCSLVPEQDRYAFTAEMEFDATGKRLNEKFIKSVIRSYRRFTYTIVNKILVDKDPESVHENHRFVDDLGAMAELAALLEKRRMKRGSIGFEIPEPVVTIENDEVTDIARSRRLLSHKLIEEFMLAANEAVAGTFSKMNLKNDREILYRIHEAPDPLKVEEFFKFAVQIGITLPKDDISPATFAKIVASVSGTPREYIVSNLLLRTMQQARYSPENVGHFGLAASDYTHFTSPIRRYPDLMIHRALARLTGNIPQPKGTKPPYASAEAAGTFLSDRERAAVDAERETVERLQVRYMAHHVGEEFEGIVSGVAPFGLFVELTESFISGGVSLTDMTDDYYELDEQNHRLIGRVSKRMIQIGDQITVQVQSVDLNRRRINFVLAN